MPQRSLLPFNAADARARYVACNAATLTWMLDRGFLGDGFLNTKVNSITGADYGAADGLRGPDFTYGWIQGRGLEALAVHAAFFSHERPALAARLDAALRVVYPALASLFERYDGHAYFRYDSDMVPVVPDGAGGVRPQSPAGALYTYSDIFVVKGLIAAAAHVGDIAARDRYTGMLMEIVAAISDNQFHSDESGLFDRAPDETRRDDFGPWMIMLGAGGLLRRMNPVAAQGFAEPIISHVLERIWERKRLLPDRRGGATANPGHALEFVGFAQEAAALLDDATGRDLLRIMTESFDAGFHPPGLVTSVESATGRLLTDKRPWWALPEAVRAAALTFERTGDPAAAAVWFAADAAFFTHYWRPSLGYAFQTRDAVGPVDFVPATPDLDPGYHTGLSLLSAIEAIDRMDGSTVPQG